MTQSWRTKGALLLNRFPALHNRFRHGKRLAAATGRGFFAAARHVPLLSRRLAKGYFSVYESIKSAPANSTGRIILEDQGRPSVGPESIAVRSGMNQHAEQPWPVVWSRHEHARLISKSLALLDEKNRVCLESAYGRKWADADPAYTYLPHASTFLRGNWTSVVSRWVPVDGETNLAHWLFDALPRLAVMGEFPPDTNVIVPEHLQPFQQDTLRWLGLAGRHRPTGEKNLLVEDYFFSSPPTMIVCYSPYAVKFLRQTILPFRDGALATPKRFFLRRTGAVRNAGNEAELIAFFQNRGWAVIDSAGMPLNAQIQLFSEAEAVCGMHGAGFAHIVWCSPSCKVVELFADKYLSGCYELLSGIVGADYRSKVFPSDTLYNARVDLEDVEHALRELGV